MVQILIKLSEESKDWSIVELQGFLESVDKPDLSGLKIGDLHFDARGVATLIIGHHVLTGKVSKLDKPFAVMKKCTETEDLSTADEYSMETGEQQSTPNKTSYNVVAFVKQKLIFKNRPRPIIVNKMPIKR